MSPKLRIVMLGLLSVATIIGVFALLFRPTASLEGDAVEVAATQPSLSVTVTMLEYRTMESTIRAHGDVTPWQEVSVGTEVPGLRLVEVNVDVGDTVKQGQVLAVYAADTIRAELTGARAAVDEAQAAVAEAQANAQRARSLKDAGSLSRQQIQRYETAERSAEARLRVAEAQVNLQQLRLDKTRILAPDEGVITSRTTTLGAVTGAGQELFRLIRHGRLEWRAEVGAPDLEKIRPGLKASITLPGGRTLEGRVRTVAPRVDTYTRSGLIYVDLPASDTARAGVFARGVFELGTRQALTLPRSAVQLRDGFGYVHRVGADGRIAELKVILGQHSDDRIEILSGLDPDAKVVASGGAFLASGDHVRVIGSSNSLSPEELQTGSIQAGEAL